MRRKHFWAALSALVMAFVIAGFSAAQGDLPEFERFRCPFPIPAGEIEGETLECGYLLVPETRSDPDSNYIELAVAIIHSPSPNVAPDPVIYLAGGPGGSALLEVELWVKAGFRAHRDIILIDQRGTGYSYPSLDCSDVDGGGDDDMMRACYDWLVGEGIDLSAYNSVTNAADIADLRRALGLEAVNLYGVSYGTRLALIVMRDHPDGIRGVVLDSVFPPEAASSDEQALHGANAMFHLFEACAHDSACDGAYGDLEALFYNLVDEMNADPVRDVDGNEVTGDDVVNMLYESLYVTEAIPTLPYALYLLDEGDIENGLDVLAGGYSLEDLRTLAAGGDLPEENLIDVEPWMTIPDGDSEGMFNSVDCHEEAPFANVSAAAALAADLPPQLGDALLSGSISQLEICAFWDSGQASPIENLPVSSDIPTLVLTGSFDPVTPPIWGQTAAESLPYSTFIKLPYAGHSVLDSGDCAASLSEHFLDNPAAPLDTACVQDFQFEFYVPQTCVVTAFDTAPLYLEPSADAPMTGELIAGISGPAGRLADDGEMYWFGLSDGLWVDEFSVEIDGDCFMLPLVG